MQMSHEVVVRPEVEEVPTLTGGERIASILLTLVQPVTRLIGRRSLPRKESIMLSLIWGALCAAFGSVICVCMHLDNHCSCTNCWVVGSIVAVMSIVAYIEVPSHGETLLGHIRSALIGSASAFCPFLVAIVL